MTEKGCRERGVPGGWRESFNNEVHALVKCGPHKVPLIMGFNNNKTLPAYLLGLGMFVFFLFMYILNIVPKQI